MYLNKAVSLWPLKRETLKKRWTSEVLRNVWRYDKTENKTKIWRYTWHVETESGKELIQVELQRTVHLKLKAGSSLLY